MTTDEDQTPRTLRADLADVPWSQVPPMTLRDFFAGWIASAIVTPEDEPKKVAMLAFRFADALVMEREK